MPFSGKKKSAFLVSLISKTDSLTHSHFKQYTFIHITVTVKKLQCSRSLDFKQYTFIHITVTVKKLECSRSPDFQSFCIDTSLREINSQCIIQTMEEEEEEKRKKKKKKRGKRRREKKYLVIQGRVSFGPSWFWADLVLGRVGFGPTWFGPSWV